MTAAEQLLLDLGHRTALGREDFLIASGNADAVAWIDAWPDWPAPALVLYGPPASGKTHLAAVWQNRTNSIWFGARDIPGLDPSKAADTAPLVVLDHIDPWIGDEAAERNVFHLYNILKERNGAMLVTMRAAPVRQNFVIRDLASRLRAAPAAAIQAPDDSVLAAVLVKMFSDRQVRIGDDALNYILPRIERSFAAARDLVEVADKLAMRQKRGISLPLLREAMAELSERQDAEASDAP